MQAEIIHNELRIDLYGLSGRAANKDYKGTAFKLMDKMWQVVKSTGLKNKGMNIWVYEENDQVFAGIELEDNPAQGAGLEHKIIILQKYAYHKHIGPYTLIKQSGEKMKAEVQAQGFVVGFPYIERYGHWMPDEHKLETELMMCLK